jgi:hypothetical protein
VVDDGDPVPQQHRHREGRYEKTRIFEIKATAYF